MSIANGPDLKWERVKRGSPCGNCEREDGLCSTSTDGKLRACYRKGGPGAVEKTASNGLPFWLFRLNGEADTNGHAEKPKRKPSPARAHPDDVHEVYSALLTHPWVILSSQNRDDLARRGLPEEEAKRRFYTSMPSHRREEIAAGLAERFGKELVQSVPGFFVNDRGQMSITAFSGLIIPCRDHLGRIIALMVRPDKPPDQKCKYLYVSSANRGGCSPGAPAHVPLGLVAPIPTIRVTEGPLKADVTTELSGEPTIGTGGVANWRPILKALKALGAEVVRMAFDADWRTNDKVAQATLACVEGLKAEGYRVEFETWDPSHGKGIDDLFAGGGTPLLLTGCAADAHLQEVEMVAYPGGRSASARTSTSEAGDSTPDGKSHLDRLADHVAKKDAAAILRDVPLLVDLAGIKAASPSVFSAIVAELKAAKIPGFSSRDFEAALKEHKPASKSNRADLPEFEFSDLGNARRLVHHHGKTILFCHDWKCWLTYAAGRWNRDRSGAVQAMAKMVSKYVKAEMPPTADPETADAYAKFSRESESTKRIRDLMELARSDVPVLPEQLDADPWSFNMLNGTLDLRTGELRPHDSGDLCTKQAPVEFDPAKSAPRFEQFEREIFNDDEELIHYIRRKIAYAMTGDDAVQEIDIWHGEGSNGKNVYADIVRAIFGDYACQAESSLLLQKRTDSHPTGVADLQGKRFVTASETDDGRRIAEALVKQLTGDAVIKARKMNENFSEFARTFKLFLCTNHKPVVRGTDYAIWRRIRLVPFGVKFVKKGEPTNPPLVREEDPDLKGTLIAEGPGIINLLVTALLDYQKNGMRTPEAVKAATAEFKGEMDTVSGFLAECCKSHLDDPKLKDKARVNKNHLYEAYGEWCKDARLASLSPRKFGSEMERRGYTLTPSSGQYYRCGISLIVDRPSERARDEESAAAQAPAPPPTPTTPTRTFTDPEVADVDFGECDESV